MLRKALMVACAAASLVAGYNQAHAETWAQQATRARQQGYKQDAPINWVYASQSERGTSRWYYDSNSIERSGGFTNVVVRMDQPDGHRIVMQMELDCPDMSVRSTYTLTITPAGKNGGVDSQPTEWRYYTTDSNIGYVAQGVCN